MWRQLEISWKIFTHEIFVFFVKLHKVIFFLFENDFLVVFFNSFTPQPAVHVHLWNLGYIEKLLESVKARQFAYIINFFSRLFHFILFSLCSFYSLSCEIPTVGKIVMMMWGAFGTLHSWSRISLIQFSQWDGNKIPVLPRVLLLNERRVVLVQINCNVEHVLFRLLYAFNEPLDAAI